MKSHKGSCHNAVEIFTVSGKMGGMESRQLQKMKKNSNSND